MGFFRSISDAMNEEFVIGERNVRRYEDDPDSLEDILREQRTRGIGSARGLRQYAREAEPQDEPRSGGMLDAVGKTVFLVGLGLLLGSKLHGRDHED